MFGVNRQLVLKFSDTVVVDYFSNAVQLLQWCYYSKSVPLLKCLTTALMECMTSLLKCFKHIMRDGQQETFCTTFEGKILMSDVVV